MYDELTRIFDLAFKRAACGKGRERHADGKPWHEQQIITLGREFRGGCLFQAVKKIKEHKRLEKAAAINELLDAIVYVAAEVYILETEDDDKSGDSNI